jgi:transposase
VATWLSKRLGRQVGRQLGWRYLRRLGAHWLKPRPRHVQADPQAQTEFKQRLRPRHARGGDGLSAGERRALGR